ncbi:MAG: 30S ribosomal protein S1 [Deltaproteobacteria bacterium]|nr:30S ribosomal protein S1 [Deltaproteobacteria bacterium]
MVDEVNKTTQHNEHTSTDETGATRKENQKDDASFVELYEQSFQDIPTGQIVKGRVVQINDDMVMVDVGYKMEGRLSRDQVTNAKGELTVTDGDEIEVFIDRKKDDDLILSREKAVHIKVWDDIVKAHAENGTVRGTVIGRVKGGLSVDIGFIAFLPGSQIDVYPVRDLDRYAGKTMDFQVLKYDRKRNNVVLSRKTILEREKDEKKQKTLDLIQEGSVAEGIIKNITDYGVFVDLGGIDGLLHITDMSWGRIRHPSELYSKDQKITVKVLSFDREKERVSLGIKQLIENPWGSVAERYPVESIVEGKVMSVTDYGAFVELEPGVEGLTHISEMFWTKKIKHPSKVLSVGDIVKVMVLEVSSEHKRISLGLKQAQENPWDALREKYPPGSIVAGKVRNITDFGIFIGVNEDIDGLVHVSDISWKKRIKHPSEFYKKGQEVRAVVLNVDVENEKFSLGIKQLEKNPWEELAEKYGPESVITGKVTNVTDFGVFVEIEEGIEGLVHISELSHKRVKSSKEMFSVGDMISAVIKNIDVKNHRVALSIKDLESSSEGSSQKQYVNNDEKVVSNLGEILSSMKI